MSHYYAKFKENPCVGTDASTPLKGILLLACTSVHLCACIARQILGIGKLDRIRDKAQCLSHLMRFSFLSL